MCKVCDRMSKQRYLLVLLIAVGSILSGQVHLQNSSILWLGDHGNDMDILFSDQFSMLYDLSSNLRWSLDNDLLRRDFPAEDQNQRFFNSMNTFALYRHGNSRAKLGYRNTLYGGADQLALYPLTQPLRVYDREMQNSAYLGWEQIVGQFNLSGGAMISSLHLTPWNYELDLDSFELIASRQKDAVLWDYRSGLKLAYSPGDGVTFHSGYQYSIVDMDASKANHQGLSELGMTSKTRLSYNTDVEVSFTWQNRQNDAIIAERTNLYNSSFYLRSTLLPQVNLSLGYSNHLCSDAKISEILLISNYLRGSLKYSFLFDETGASYLLAGGKYSPENKADAIFGQFDVKTVQSFSIGGGLLLSPDSHTEYNARVAYRLGVHNSLSLLYRYREHEADSALWRYLGIGFDYIY